jgi:hypothetical protein
LIEVAIGTFHTPDRVKKMVIDYFAEVQIHFTVGEFTTVSQNLEKGIMTECTISSILSVMEMSLVTTAANKERDKRLQDEL